jgi:hypothetical protein
MKTKFWRLELVILSGLLCNAGLGAVLTQAKLSAFDGSGGDAFGSAVALQGDTAVVTAPSAAAGTGAAYVFVHRDGSWKVQQKLVAPDGASGDWFGSALAINGRTLVVGARYDGATFFQAGAAYVFGREGTNWSLQQKLLSPDITRNQSFGVAVATEGDTIVVGVIGAANANAGQGAAYVFVRNGTALDSSTNTGGK